MQPFTPVIRKPTSFSVRPQKLHLFLFLVVFEFQGRVDVDLPHLEEGNCVALVDAQRYVRVELAVEGSLPFQGFVDHSLFPLCRKRGRGRGQEGKQKAELQQFLRFHGRKNTASA